jgi:hypothetical protein
MRTNDHRARSISLSRHTPECRIYIEAAGPVCEVHHKGANYHDERAKCIPENVQENTSHIRSAHFAPALLRRRFVCTVPVAPMALLVLVAMAAITPMIMPVAVFVRMPVAVFVRMPVAVLVRMPVAVFVVAVLMLATMSVLWSMGVSVSKKGPAPSSLGLLVHLPQRLFLGLCKLQGRRGLCLGLDWHTVPMPMSVPVPAMRVPVPMSCGES